MIGETGWHDSIILHEGEFADGYKGRKIGKMKGRKVGIIIKKKEGR